MSRIDLDEVRAALRTQEVLSFYGWTVKKAGSQLESHACPNRSDHSRRRAFVIDEKTGRWRCFPCGTSGDLFTFVGEVERLDDFRSILAKTASIAGVSASDISDEERRARQDEWRRRALEEEEAERRATAERNQSAIGVASAHWERLPQADPRGSSYLAKRHVDEVLEIDNCVRFDPAWEGSPSVPLYNSRGEIWNVVTRRLPELGEPKTRGLRACPTAGTLINPVTAIESGRDVVITEGVVDSLTARIAMHTATVLGAHGADNLSKVVKVAAPIAKKKGSRLVIVPHQDDAGFREARKAIDVALDAKFSIVHGSLVVLHHPEKDLNDAWQRGWRAA